MTQIRYIPDRVIDTDGISDGASIHVYQTGTTTPVDLFSNEEMTNPVPNPYVVSAGAAVPLLYHNYADDIRLYIVSTSGSVTDEDPYIPLVTSANISDYAVSYAATRAVMATKATSNLVALTEAGREGSFVFDDGDLSDEVAADTQQGVYVAPSSDTTGASGAWVRKFTGPIDPTWFGLIYGDDSANSAANATAVAGMLAACEAIGIRHIRFADTCWIGGNANDVAIEITTAAYQIDGPGGSGLATPAAWIKCPAGVTGISVTGDGKGTHINNVALEGSFTGTEAEVHGMYFAAKVSVSFPTVEGFEGDGIYFDGNSSGSGGNVNSSVVIRPTCTDNRNGIYFDGTDGNAVVVLHPNCNTNRQAGINDSSFLGNHFFGGQLSTNGVTAYNDGVNIGASCVTYSGNVYGVFVGQETGASTNAPSGTTADNTYWYYIIDVASAGSVLAGVPAWTSGMLLRAGGCVLKDTQNAYSTFVGVYVEQNQGKGQIAQKALVSGGGLPSWLYKGTTAANTSGYVDAANAGYLKIGPYVEVSSTDVTSRIGDQLGNANLNAFTAIHNTWAVSGYKLKFGGSNFRLTYGNSTIVFEVTGPTSTDQFGTGAAYAQAFYPVALMVGDSRSNARLLSNGTTAPASGAHGQGEFYFDRSSTTGLQGWKCTTAGTPGTWEAIYTGYGKSAIGYATGSGGTVTQATSKSTGVTLNKLTGQITLNAAALAASTNVTFTLTNSQIAAGDLLVLNHVAGGTAGSYNLNAQSTAGSATINVRNVSLGSLSEAIVIGFAVIKAVTS